MRNGTQSKMVLTEIGPVQISPVQISPVQIKLPGDRDGSLEPVIEPKRNGVWTG